MGCSFHLGTRVMGGIGGMFGVEYVHIAFAELCGVALIDDPDASFDQLDGRGGVADEVFHAFEDLVVRDVDFLHVRCGN